MRGRAGRVLDAASSSANRAYETQRRLTRLRNVVLLTETAQRGYLLTDKRSYLISIDDQRAEAEKLLKELDSTLTRDALRGLLSELGPRIIRKLDEMQSTIALKEGGNQKAALDVVKTDDGKALMDDINNRINTLQEAELEVKGEHWFVRTELHGTCTDVLRAAGVAIPSTIRHPSRGEATDGSGGKGLSTSS